ncbi:hypothetical protein AGMMS49992_16740 [Clostridia bacterium]|nr:hypothetical protein AGMMS49992_16740 [Clostridia bacterium]
MSMPKIAAFLQKLDRDQALNSVVASIALSEAALSHVMNAEGEKVQLAVAKTDPNSALVDALYFGDPDAAMNDLLLVNDSVSDMTESAYVLEYILQSKLRSVLDFIGPSFPMPGWTGGTGPGDGEGGGGDGGGGGSSSTRGYIFVGEETVVGRSASGEPDYMVKPLEGMTVGFIRSGRPDSGDAWGSTERFISRSDAKGHAEFILLPGLYVVYIIALPGGNAQWVPTSKRWTLRVTEDGYTIGGYDPDQFPGLTVVDTNTAAQDVEFIPVDSATGKYLPGGLYHFEGILDGAHVTDVVNVPVVAKPDAGSVRRRLPYGYYTVVQDYPPEGYVLSDESYAMAHNAEDLDVREEGYEFIENKNYLGLNKPIVVYYTKVDGV